MTNLADQLHAATEDGILGNASEIYDETQQKFQSEINSEMLQQLAGAAQQGDNPNATNTAILSALANLDFSSLAKQGTNSAATNTAILAAFSNIDFSALATLSGQQAAAAELATIKQRIGESADASTASTLFGKIASVVSAIGNIDFSTLATEANATLNKEAIIAAMQSVPTVQQIQSGLATSSALSSVASDAAAAKTAAEGIVIPTDYAKQGTNPNATLSAILEALQGSGTPSPDIPKGVAERLAMILEFFGITAATQYTALTDAEVIACCRDEQYNVMGDAWPIPAWLPDGLTEQDIQTAATALGITYHAPTETPSES